MALSALLKLGIDRPRPELVPHTVRVFSQSFPSGHAVLSAVTYLTLGAMLCRTHRARRLRVHFPPLRRMTFPTRESPGY